MRRQKITGGYTHVSCEPLVTPDHAALQRHNFSFHAFSGRQNVLACRCEPIAMSRAVKQPHSQSLLKGDDSARDGGMAHVEQVGSGTYRRMPNHGQKYLDVVPIHGECSVRHLFAALTEDSEMSHFCTSERQVCEFPRPPSMGKISRLYRRSNGSPPPERQCTNRGLFDHDKFNPHYQILTSSGHRVRCSGAFDRKTEYRTSGACGVTTRIRGCRCAQLLRSVARPPG